MKAAKRTVSVFLGVMVAAVALAETADVNVIRKVRGRRVVERQTAELKQVDATTWRYVCPKEQIGDDVLRLEVIPQFMRARVGDAGYWFQGRGVWGSFKPQVGTNFWTRIQIPVFGLKRGDRLWYGQMKTYRFDFETRIAATAEGYEVYPSVVFPPVRDYGDLYDDVVIDFRLLEGADADYAGVAREYQAGRVRRGELKPIKERMKTQPSLAYMCECLPVRIQQHAAKDIPPQKTDFLFGQEPPMKVYMPFCAAEDFVTAIHDAGVDKAAIVSAGWNTGGYDGRLPDHFPVEPVLGGEQGLRKLIALAKGYGYLFMLHATYTEVYRCCEHYDAHAVAKRRDGSLSYNGLYFGGTCYWVCPKCSMAEWLPAEMRRMKDLGIEGCHYIDFVSTVYPNRCADPKHPATVEQMAEVYREMFREAKRVFGGCWSEGGMDQMMGETDHINYVSGDLRRIWDGNPLKRTAFGEGVFPFWELVYHGYVLACPDRLCQNHTRGLNHPKTDEAGNMDWLEGDGIVDPRISLKLVEFGGQPIFYSYRFRDVPMMKRAYDEFVPYRHLMKERMTGHREVAKGLFETTYENGESTLCNYSAEARQGVPAWGYVIRDAAGKVSFARSFDDADHKFQPGGGL